MTRSSSVASLILAVLVAIEAHPADGPPSKYNPGLFRGGPQRLGDLGGGGLPEHGELLWRFDFKDDLGSPVVADGVVYVTDRGGSLYAFKADGSEIAWQDDKPGRQVHSAPTVVGDRIYLATDQGLCALAKDGGRALWSYPEAGDVSQSSPLPAGGNILVAGTNGFLYAVKAADGSLAWKCDIGSDAPAAPAGFEANRGRVGNGQARPRTMASDGSTALLPIFDQSRVVAIDAATGKQRWSFQSKGWMYGEPAIAGDDVFVTSQDTHLYCLDKATGKPRWSFKTGGRVESGVAVRDGSVYFGSCDGLFYKVEAKTGNLAWKFATEGDGEGHASAIYSSPIVSADTACFCSFDGHVYAVNTADGKLRWKVRPAEGGEVSSSPVTDGRSIFATVRSNQFKKVGANALFAIGEAKPK